MTMVFLALSFSSCTTKEEVKPDTSPIRIQTNAVGNVSAERAILHGEILYLNDEEVLDYGFYITEQNSEKEQKISLGKKAEPGIVSFEYRPDKNFVLGEYYRCSFYVITATQSYRGGYQNFTVRDFWIDQEGIQYITLGDTLLLTGNFKQITGDFVVKPNFPPAVSLPIIKKDDTTFSIKIPENMGRHNTRYELYLARDASQNWGASIPLITIQVQGKIEFLVEDPQYLADIVRMKTYGLEWHNNDFLILVGDKKISYYGQDLRVDGLNLRGLTHRLGYFNGKDTVISKQKLVFIKPDPSEFKVAKEGYHPGEWINITSPLLFNYFGDSDPELRIGPVLVDNIIYFSPQTSFNVGTPTMDRGTYPLVLHSSVYGNLLLPSQINVEPLRPVVLDKKPYYYHDEIQLQGNFRTDAVYVVQAGEHYELFRGKAEQGKIKFKLTAGNFGDQQLQVGFVDEGYYPVFDQGSEVSINIVGAQIDSFHPTSGHAGDIVTVKGKGFLSGGYTSVSLADFGANILSRTDTELKFLVPTTVRKGKFPIQLDYYFFKGRVFSNALFEIK